MGRFTALLAVLAFGAVAPGVAQVPPATGQRVRVRFSSGEKTIGFLDSVSAGVLYLRGAGASRSLPVARIDIALIEGSLGRQREFGRRFRNTIGVAALIVGAFEVLDYEPCEVSSAIRDCSYEPGSRTEALAVGMLEGAFLAIPVGVMIGLIKTEHWAPIRLPADERTVPFAERRGRRLGFIARLRL